MLDERLRDYLSEAGLIPEQAFSAHAVLAGLLLASILLAGVAADYALLKRRKALGAAWPQALRRLREQPWSMLDLAFATMGLTSVYLFAIGAAQWSMRESGSVWFLFALRAAASAGFLCATLLLARERLRTKGASWKQGFSTETQSLGRSIGAGLFAYAAFMPAFALIGMLHAALLQGIGLQVERQEILRVFMDPSLPVWVRPTIAFLALAIAPLWEELFFRGIATAALVKQSRFWLATAGVSLLFAAIHGNPTAVVPLFVLGIGLTLAYVLGGNIVVPIVMHAAFNSVTLALSLLLRDTMQG